MEISGPSARKAARLGLSDSRFMVVLLCVLVALGNGLLADSLSDEGRSGDLSGSR